MEKKAEERESQKREGWKDAQVERFGDLRSKKLAENKAVGRFLETVSRASIAWSWFMLCW